MLLAVSVALAGEPCVWRAEPLPLSAEASWGSTFPALALTPEDGGARVWFSSGRRKPMVSAQLTDSGRLASPMRFEPFAGLGEVGTAVLSADGQAAASSVYVEEKNADIFLVTRDGDGWSAPVALRPNDGLDNGVVVAHSGERTAAAWSSGTYPSAPDISVAVVEDGVVHSSGVIIEGGHAEGLALVAVPSGWLLLYTPSSAGPRTSQRLVSVLLSPDGEVLSQNTVAYGAMIWPVAALGHGGVGVAVRSGREVGFLKLSLTGEPIGQPAGKPISEIVRADFHPDPIGSFRPMSLVADETGWWLGDVATFSASVIIARPSEGRIVRLDAAGEPQSVSIIGSPETGVNSVRLLSTDQGLRGVFVTDRESVLGGVSMVCGEPPEPTPLDACAATSLAPVTDPRARIVETVAVDDDLAVIIRGDDGSHVRRLDSSGGVQWEADVPSSWVPRLAHRAGEVAVLTREEGLTLRRYAARSGRLQGSHVLQGRSVAACIAGHDDGWLVVRSGGRTWESLLLEPAGVVLSAESESESGGFGSCDLLVTPEGYLLTLTHPGQYTETNHLFTIRLGPDGSPLTGEQRVESVNFARRPQLSVSEAGTLLTFTGPLGRDVSAVALDDAGLACGEDREIASTYGLTGFSAWSDQILWSTNDGVFARGCLETLACSD